MRLANLSASAPRSCCVVAHGTLLAATIVGPIVTAIVLGRRAGRVRS
jgi:hypothetical protein